MKGVTRYYRDPQFRAAIDLELSRAAAVVQPNSWITYAIHDPLQADDIEGRPEGMIVYVGQSKNFGQRVRKRLASAGRAMTKPSDDIDRLLFEIMAKGPVPRWTVLEQVYTALDSLVSETNWALRLSSSGYRLANKWREHRPGGQLVCRYDIEHRRLWQITADDAIRSKIDLLLMTEPGAEGVPIDLALFPHSIRLQKIKAHVESSGGRAKLVIR